VFCSSLQDATPYNILKLVLPCVCVVCMHVCACVREKEIENVGVARNDVLGLVLLCVCVVCVYVYLCVREKHRQRECSK